MNNLPDTPRLCSHCDADISHKRPQAIFCGDACRKDHNRASKSVVVTRKCGCDGCNATFEAANGRIYCDDKCANRAKNKRRDRRARNRQDDITKHIYKIAKTPDALHFMLAYIDSDNTDDERALTNASLVFPRRKSHSRVKLAGFTRGENRAIGKIVRELTEQHNSALFLNNDITNRTAPEIADAFCRAMFGVGIMQYRAHSEHWVLPVRRDFAEEVMSHGLPDWIIFHDDQYGEGMAKTIARAKMGNMAFPRALFNSHKALIPQAIAILEQRKANGTYKPRKKKAA